MGGVGCLTMTDLGRMLSICKKTVSNEWLQTLIFVICFTSASLTKAEDIVQGEEDF
jgi:hypothetical protein